MILKSVRFDKKLMYTFGFCFRSANQLKDICCLIYSIKSMRITMIACFFLVLQLLTLTQSTHHQHSSDPLTRANTPLSLQQFERFFRQGIPIIDTRHFPENGIIKGAYWTTENGNVTKLVSFVLDPDQEYIMVSDSPKRTQIINDLLEGGFTNMLGYNDFDIKEWKGDLMKAGIKKLSEMDKAMEQAFIDVRSKEELQEMGMFKDALWVPITELEKRLDEIEEYMKNNTDKEVFIHCRAGPRARLGASILMGKGLGPINVLNEKLDTIREKLVPFKEEQEL